MSKGYRAIEGVADPIILVRGVQGVTYDEMGEVELTSGEKHHCKILEIGGGNAMVQLCEASTGINLDFSKVRLLGRIMELGVSEDMLSHTFDGMGKPINSGPDILPKKRMDINGLPMNPAARSYPEEFIRTDISAIDGLSTLVRGQELPTFSVFGLPRANLATRIARQAKVRGTDESFVIVSAAVGITFEEVNPFMEGSRETGAIDRSVMFINLASDLAVERIATPRMALTTAEYLVFEKNMHVLVILTDTTNYVGSLRETSAACKEVPRRSDYPGYIYADLASLHERTGRQKGKSESIIMTPTPTMPENDRTHPILDLIDYVTGGRIILSRELYHKSMTPPVDVLPSLPRLKNKDIGEDKTCVDRADTMNQPFAAYARGKDTKELMIILGEAALTDMGKLYARFADEFEKEYVSRSYYTGRDIEKTMEIGWKFLRILPGGGLKRIENKFLDLYCETK